MADDKNLSGHYELASWYMHGGRRLAPGSRVFLDHDEAARLLAQKVAKPCDAPTPETEDFSGDYILRCWHMQPLDTEHVKKLGRIPPGKPARLSHEDAKRMKAKGLIVRKAEASDFPSEDAAADAPASEPTSSAPEAPTADAKAPKPKGAKKAVKLKADEPPAPSIDGQNSAS